MTLINSFDCHAFLNNTTLAILEISTRTNSPHPATRAYHWLLIDKRTLNVKTLHLNSRDDSTSIQERYFDMGYLKYDAIAGVFIAQDSNEFHPLEHLTCDDIPKNLLGAVDDHLNLSEFSVRKH